MASNIKSFIKGNRVKHAVGNVTSWRQPQLFINGAKCAEDIDNFSMVEVEYVEGEPVVKYATASAKAENVLLMVTPEEVLDKQFGEKISDFYNEKGDPSTPAYFENGLSFATSGVDSISTVKEGNLLVWDAAKKLYAVKAVPEVTDVKVFRCTSIETDERYVVDGLAAIELTVIR